MVDISVDSCRIKDNMRLFGTSGIRNIADKSLVSLAFRVGLAAGQIYGNVVVGRDPRTSGDAIKHALISGLLSAGSRCEDIGVVPTPTVAFAARRFDAGVMITASHNPPEYNGMKLINPDGSAFDAGQQKQLEEMIFSDSAEAASWQKIKQGSVYSRAAEDHVDRIMQDFPSGLRCKVVIDCGGGAASLVTPGLLRKLGCEVMDFHCQPDGFFPRVIEPTEANLDDLIKATAYFSADVGIAHDGDADRMMAVDDRGRFIPGDKLLAVFARALGAKEIVTTVDASMSIDEVGFSVRRTKVGDTYVSEELRSSGDFGGEPSGSWVFPGISFCPDGVYAAAKIAAIASQCRLSELVDTIPAYPILRGNINSRGVATSGLELKLMAMEPLSVSNTDGIKLNFEDGWLLVRPSGTEPKIRLTAEAKNEARARQLYDDGLNVIKDCMENGRRKG